MDITRIPVGPLETNCWLVADNEGGVTVIDPGDDTEVINDAIADRPVRAVILTHGHFDHIGSADEVADDNSSFVWMHADEKNALPRIFERKLESFGVEPVDLKVDHVVVEGDTIDAGDLSFEVIHTPGHTPGSMCLLVRDPASGSEHLFSGDTLFAGSVGRTDFDESVPEAMEPSLEMLAERLAPQVVVHPGHGPETTIERESRVNPFWPAN
jgi:glyoxylase-like metal-dependent hydrolase (beta-lactamase superfamily II)